VRLTGLLDRTIGGPRMDAALKTSVSPVASTAAATWETMTAVW
jgi:hypothetical protein